MLGRRPRASHDRPLVTCRYPGLWPRVKRGLRLSGDLLRMLPWMLNGQTTITDGSGIVRKFETAFCRLTGSAFALAMTNGTATLHSAYFAVGVGPGSEVIVPSYTWHASATPVLQCGATPVFCDIDPYTLTADPDDIERRITGRTKAICVVHVWGNPAEMDRIMEIAARYGVKVIEDCSHAHGAVYKGKSVGSWGAIGCFSLNSGKAVDAGEGGVAVTDDPVLFDRMLLLGHFGRIKNGQAAQTFNVGDMSLGLKYRPHTAAIHLAMASLPRLAELNARCEESWRILCEETRGVDGIRPQLTLPRGTRGGYMAHVFVYEGQELGGPPREEFVEAVRGRGVPLSADRYCQINYTYGMLHQAPLFTSLDRRALGGVCCDPTRPWQDIATRVSLPVCERVSQQLVSFPRLDQISPQSVRRFGQTLRKVLTTVVPQSKYQTYEVESVHATLQGRGGTGELT